MEGGFSVSNSHRAEGRAGVAAGHCQQQRKAAVVGRVCPSALFYECYTY